MRPTEGYSDPARVAARAAALGAATIGRSIEGRPIVAITVGSGEPVSLVLGGIHPIEWIGVEVALGLAERFAAAPPRDRRIVIVPVINVDGHAAIAGDLAAGKRSYVRTNRRGVDLNRNFATGHARPSRWSPKPRAGRAPCSEPETAAIGALVDGLGKIDRAIALHAFGRMILLPWAHRGETSPRHAELLAHANAIARELPGPYRVLHTGRWPVFRPGGLEVDWLTTRGALAMLVECGRGGVSLDPATWLTPFRWYNPADPSSEVRALINALEPFLRA